MRLNHCKYLHNILRKLTHYLAHTACLCAFLDYSPPTDFPDAKIINKTLIVWLCEKCKSCNILKHHYLCRFLFLNDLLVRLDILVIYTAKLYSNLKVPCFIFNIHPVPMCRRLFVLQKPSQALCFRFKGSSCLQMKKCILMYVSFGFSSF